MTDANNPGAQDGLRIIEQNNAACGTAEARDAARWRRLASGTSISDELAERVMRTIWPHADDWSATTLKTMRRRVRIELDHLVKEGLSNV